MKMITLFLPEKYLEMLDNLVAANMYPNRSEALRIATWNFLHENRELLAAAAAAHAETKEGEKGDVLEKLLEPTIEA